MTRETLVFLLDLVNRLNLQVGSATFGNDVAVVVKAKAELSQALEEVATT